MSTRSWPPNVAGGGIERAGISQVINFDAPQDREAYVTAAGAPATSAGSPTSSASTTASAGRPTAAPRRCRPHAGPAPSRRRRQRAGR
jgi:hypothetical protein